MDTFRAAFFPNDIFFDNDLNWPVWSKALAEEPQWEQGSDRRVMAGLHWLTRRWISVRSGIVGVSSTSIQRYRAVRSGLP